MSQGKTGPQWGEKIVRGLIVGRDKTVVPPEEVQALSALGCTGPEICDFFGITLSTLRYNFSVEIAKGGAELKQKLRRAMLHNAIANNNAAVQIFLAKNILSMSDNGMVTDASQVLPWTDDEPEKITPAQRTHLENEYEDLQVDEEQQHVRSEV